MGFSILNTYVTAATDPTGEPARITIPAGTVCTKTKLSSGNKTPIDSRRGNVIFVSCKVGENLYNFIPLYDGDEGDIWMKVEEGGKRKRRTRKKKRKSFRALRV